MESASAWTMAGAASAHQVAAATREDTSQQRAGRTRRTSADPQRAQKGASAPGADAPAALQTLSRLQQLANASPQVAQLRRLQALADNRFAPVAQFVGGPEEEELVQGQFASAELPAQLQKVPLQGWSAPGHTVWQLRAEAWNAVSVAQRKEGHKKRSQERVNDYIKQGSRMLGASIGILRPYIDKLEKDLKFLAGVIQGGFHWSSLTQLLASIRKKDPPKDNPALHESIADYMRNVISNKKDYTSILNELATYREGRISELEGMRGELAACVQLINAGKQVRGMGQIYTITEEDVASQEVDVTVDHEGKRYFVEVAATSSMLNKKLSESGAQMKGYQALERSTKNSRFAYSCPNLSMKQISPELIAKLKEARACLVVNGGFFEPQELEQEIAKLSTSGSGEKTVKRGNMPFAVYNARKHDQAKKANRGYRRERLADRGEKLTAKDLLRDEMADYDDYGYSDEAYSDEEYSEEEY